MKCQIYGGGYFYEFEISQSHPVPAVDDLVYAFDFLKKADFVGTVVERKFIFPKETVMIYLADVSQTTPI